jgi:hypothetical protein
MDVEECMFQIQDECVKKCGNVSLKRVNNGETKESQAFLPQIR